MQIILKAIGICVTLAYPVLVYFGLSYFNVNTLLFALSLLALVRGVLDLRAKDLTMGWSTIVCAVVLLLCGLFRYKQGIFLYPVIINMTMFALFAYSLKKKPCVIERLARLRQPNLSEQAIKYTENVTRIWCAFFIINMTISAYTAYFTSLEVWTLYNGLVAYVLMGTLMVVEWIVRKRVQQQHALE